jgi:hypothetical protein
MNGVLAALFAYLTSSEFLHRLTVYSAAGFSLFDVGTDIYSTSSAYSAGNTDLGSALLSTIILSNAVQIIVVINQHRHRGIRRVAQEICFVVCGFKPFVDTTRLVGNVEIDGLPMSISTERAICEVIEMVCEAIPAAIIQIVYVLDGSQLSLAIILSIAASCVAIAAMSCGIFVSKDRAAENKLYDPAFYGATRDSRMPRAVTYVSLFLLQLSHVVAKLATVSLLFTTSGKALAAYISGTMALYLAYKLARRDWWWWPVGTGPTLSFLGRLIPKVFTDFTGNPHFRHPLDLGGACWLITLLETQCAFIATCFVYSHFNHNAGKIERGILLAFLGTITGVWAVALLAFLLSIQRSHLPTFASLETAEQYVHRHFRQDHGNDERRAAIFQYNRRLWQPFYPEIHAWVASSHGSWVGMAWYTDAVRATIPSDLLPLVNVGP